MNQNRILIVEDESLVAADLEERLERLGYEVVGRVDTGEAAVLEAGRLQPELVLMDIRLHGPMNGLQAARRIRIKHQIPVVFLTAHAEKETVEEAGLSEPMGYLIKPFEDRELHATMAVALRCRQTEGHLKQANATLEKRVREHLCALDEANHDLRLSTERYEAAVRGTNDGIWDWNIKTNEDYFSDRWCELLGYGPGELAAHAETWVSRLHPEERDWVLGAARAHLEQRVPHDIEYRLLTKNRGYRWFRARGQAVWNESGMPVRMAGSISDITDRKLAEANTLAYQEQLRAMSAQLLQTEEKERRRIASDLHDQVGQTLAACRIKLGECAAEGSDSAVKAKAEEIRTLLEQAIQETRSLMFDLSPPVLHELGLVPALDWLAEKHTVPNGLQVACDAVHSIAVPPELSVLLFRITRELLLNVVEHARAHHADIKVDASGNLFSIEVVDDGIGFDAASAMARASDAGGFGLFSIRDRLRFVGGRLDVESSPGRGARVVVTAPLVPETIPHTNKHP